ncbi:glycosyltransferase family 2 protein [Arcicella rosea]|uniref:Glycosyltransferase involved in cell wall biosynthesis n=1 Tax=Arcicella rosea TaxID=502909 RepID=A0A841EWY5_9BACT|nr:glycosyltransferase family 2 protein [Arcicella rosea]MBB6004830.1 glycosyltransferase involved in cell wall biosynthesis [Arcicella rosea]
MKKIVVIIPAFNEENAVGIVIREIPKHLVAEIIVVNNNSNDQTAQIAKEAGATVLNENRQGYGWACLKGIDYCKQQNILPDIAVFMDADHSDYPEEMSRLIKPIIEQNFDMVIGSRALGKRERGSMTPQQIFGNWLATNLIKIFYGVTYTDLGPFRAITFEKLIAMKMQDTTYGWTVEMQLKAAKMKLKVAEVPVNYRSRIGISKVSGTLKGTIMAGYKILSWIFKYL